MEWKPIETAPKDGSRILLGDLSGYIEVGFWDCASSRWMDDGRAGWIDHTWPTHWMPLPAPPA